MQPLEKCCICVSKTTALANPGHLTSRPSSLPVHLWSCLYPLCNHSSVSFSTISRCIKYNVPDLLFIIHLLIGGYYYLCVLICILIGSCIFSSNSCSWRCSSHLTALMCRSSPPPRSRMLALGLGAAVSRGRGVPELCPHLTPRHSGVGLGMEVSGNAFEYFEYFQDFQDFQCCQYFELLCLIYRVINNTCYLVDTSESSDKKIGKKFAGYKVEMCKSKSTTKPILLSSIRIVYRGKVIIHW